MSFDAVSLFEKKIAEFFGAPYAVATDSCTHALELALRLYGFGEILVPKRTYLSIPMLAYKLDIDLYWKDEIWEDYYYISHNIIDAAVLWKPNSYVKNTLMGISFQYKKHLSLGRGGALLLDNESDYLKIKKMSYDGRLPNSPWIEQNIDTIGYHYYMTPETAQRGLDTLDNAIKKEPKKWTINDWPDISKMKIFNDIS